MCCQLLCFFRHGLQGIADQADCFPFIEEYGAQVAVKLDRRRVPIQHFPAHAEILFLPRDSGHMREQRPANSVLAELRTDIEVVQKQSWPPLKRGIKLEKQGI